MREANGNIHDTRTKPNMMPPSLGENKGMGLALGLVRRCSNQEKVDSLNDISGLLRCRWA